VRGEAGFTMVEVMVSALLLVMVCVGMFGAIEAASRSGAEERHRAQANGLAQQDQARMRAMQISDLANLQQTRTVTEDGTPYTVVSRGDFVTDSTGTSSCGAGSASADYIKVTSTVTWASIGSRPPVVNEGIVTPPSGSVDSNHGALAIQVNNSQNTGLSGVSVSGSGAGSFSGTTGSSGCVLFGDLPVGNYTLTPSGSGIVDKDGNAPSAQTTSVIGGSTNTVALQYDRPGTIPVTFTTKVGASLVASTADSVVVFNTGMTAAKMFGTPGTRTASISATPLFPFSSPISVYAGTCTGDNPGAANAAIASVTVPANGSAPASIQLPALNLTVHSGSSSSSPGSLVSNGRVTVSDKNCTPTTPFKRTLTTNSSGQLPDRGLPWSTYDVCADNGTRRMSVTNVNVKDLTNGTTLDLYLSGTGSVTGVCP
jgi:Tfp pilus assembly protein PilV